VVGKEADVQSEMQNKQNSRAREKQSRIAEQIRLTEQRKEGKN
jgi:hypothetical protein